MSFLKQMRELRSIKCGCAVDFSGLNVSCIVKEETIGLDSVAPQDPSEFSLDDTCPSIISRWLLKLDVAKYFLNGSQKRAQTVLHCQKQ